MTIESTNVSYEYIDHDGRTNALASTVQNISQVSKAGDKTIYNIKEVEALASNNGFIIYFEGAIRHIFNNLKCFLRIEVHNSLISSGFKGSSLRLNEINNY